MEGVWTETKEIPIMLNDIIIKNEFKFESFQVKTHTLLKNKIVKGTVNRTPFMLESWLSFKKLLKKQNKATEKNIAKTIPY